LGFGCADIDWCLRWPRTSTIVGNTPEKYNKEKMLTQNNNFRSLYKKNLKEYLNVEHVFTFWKGRVALYAILKAIDVREGDEIILPAFTWLLTLLFI
jgi:dTDP-4-amino-4,6-dideoxygalactose transaminase